jgi:hypothetical protein
MYWRKERLVVTASLTTPASAMIKWARKSGARAGAKAVAGSWRVVQCNRVRSALPAEAAAEAAAAAAEACGGSQYGELVAAMRWAAAAVSLPLPPAPTL